MDWDEKSSATYVYKKIVEAFQGPLAGKIIEVLAEYGELTEDELAEKVGVDESEVRRVMWVLAQEGLITSKKVVNETGWMTFYWQLPLTQIDGTVLGLYRRVIDRLEEKLRYESENTMFYWCMNPDHDRYNLLEAAEYMYKCPICGKPLIPHDNSELIAALKYCISEMKKILNNYFVEERIQEEEEKKS